MFSRFELFALKMFSVLVCVDFLLVLQLTVDDLHFYQIMDLV